MRYFFSIYFLLLFTLLSNNAHALDNLKFDGELVREPCTLSPDDENLSLNFGTIIDKYIYINERTEPLMMKINLMNCDASIAQFLHLSFKGAASSELPGYLSMTTNGVMTGVAIGVLDIYKKSVSINSNDRVEMRISDGDDSVEFYVFLRGEPTAIKNKLIKRGGFSATMFFFLAYD